MAIEFWLLRHGAAEAHGRRLDAERRLTAKGERQARAAGAALATLGYEFKAVFSSPKVRAWDTAELAAASLGLEPIEHAPLANGADLDELLTLQTATGGRILIVGHDPYCSQLVHDATGARVGMVKGGVAGMRLHGGPGELAVLLRPQELAIIATGSLRTPGGRT